MTDHCDKYKETPRGVVTFNEYICLACKQEAEIAALKAQVAALKALKQFADLLYLADILDEQDRTIHSKIWHQFCHLTMRAESYRMNMRNKKRSCRGTANNQERQYACCL